VFNDEYAKLTDTCKISKLTEIFSFYYADTNDVQVLARECIELDIRSAFPTICRLMFGEDHAFVKKIFEIDNKFERNKFIAITLKKQGEIDNRKYLEELNSYCKLIIFGKVYNNYDNVEILEYKKDGLLFNGELRDVPHFKSVEDYLEKGQITFGKMFVRMYIRFNKTSIYQYDNNTEIKGKFKECPLFIYEEVLPILLREEKLDGNKIKKIYTKEFFEILKQNTIMSKIKYYYGFGSETTQFLDLTGKLTKSVNQIDPNQVLIKFLYPIISLLRSET
jgi:hypothetical protein